MLEDRRPDPLGRLWRGSLLLLGSVVAVALTLQLLAAIWGWLLLASSIAGVIVTVVLVLRARRNRW